ncbi:MAG: methyltransferase domain-containing protein [Pseudomonadota bacterium]
MWTDITDIRNFYSSALGRVARRLILRRLMEVWPDLKGDKIAGIGYATPYMQLYRENAERCLAMMPARQGVVNWPSEGLSSSALIDEDVLPLTDGAVERVMLAHCLEHADDPGHLLHETSRILAPGGRLMMIVPNRRGVWARIDNSPFGHGRPFSRGQLTRLMRECHFSPSEWREALYVPPITRYGILRMATAMEALGHAMPPFFGGVLIVEAVKEYRVPRPAHALERVRRRLPDLNPAPVPVPANRAGPEDSGSSF